MKNTIDLEKTQAEARENSLELHPLAYLFPVMSKDDYEKLRDDIRANGLQEPITLWQGKIIDGRHRDAACLELGIQPGVCELEEDDDPTSYVLSKNLHRRHLSQSQRAQCAAEVAKMREGRPGKETMQTCIVSEADAAKAFSVSVRSVATAKHVADKGDKAVVDAVKAGTITVNAAKNLVDAVPNKKHQITAVQGGRAAIKKAIGKKPKPVKTEPVEVPKAEAFMLSTARAKLENAIYSHIDKWPEEHKDDAAAHLEQIAKWTKGRQPEGDLIRPSGAVLKLVDQFHGGLLKTTEHFWATMQWKAKRGEIEMDIDDYHPVGQALDAIQKSMNNLNNWLRDNFHCCDCCGEEVSAAGAECPKCGPMDDDDDEQPAGGSEGTL